MTFNSGINAERDGDGKRPPILGQKLGMSSRSPAFLLALAVLVIVVAMSALPASCEKAAASASPAAEAADLGEELSRLQRPESRMLVSRPRQPRLTKEWRQQRRQVKLMQQSPSKNCELVRNVRNYFQGNSRGMRRRKQGRRRGNYVRRRRPYFGGGGGDNDLAGSGENRLKDRGGNRHNSGEESAEEEREDEANDHGEPRSFCRKTCITIIPGQILIPIAEWRLYCKGLVRARACRSTELVVLKYS